MVFYLDECAWCECTQGTTAKKVKREWLNVGSLRMVKFLKREP
jgi:hypothetical protein